MIPNTVLRLELMILQGYLLELENAPGDLIEIIWRLLDWRLPAKRSQLEGILRVQA